MATTFICDHVFNNGSRAFDSDQAIVVGDGRIEWRGAKSALPTTAAANDVVDLADAYLVPGLIDVHTHLSYGNAKTEEDIDIYAPFEFRALRGMFFAQQVLAAGYTSICVPGDSGRVSSSIRDAIRAGLFQGPRISTAGCYITSRQGLADFYPTWIGAPETSIGRIVRSSDEAIEEIRRQVKDGVDCVKIAMDGTLRGHGGELVAAFTADESKRMIDEIHRLGRKAITHARGREGTLYSARAGADLIFHASDADDECLQAMVDNRCAIGPTLTFLRNIVDYTQAIDGTGRRGRPPIAEREFERACAFAAKAHKAGVPLYTGTDSGFAVTPCGEWHAKEIELFVSYLGVSAGEAIDLATRVSGRMLTETDEIGEIVPGKRADFLAVDRDPLKDIQVLNDRDAFRGVYLNGAKIDHRRRTYDPMKVSDFAQSLWTELYTQERVAQLYGQASVGATV